MFTDINECAPNSGLGPCAQICSNTEASFFCSCLVGYTRLSEYGCIGKKNCHLLCIVLHV